MGTTAQTRRDVHMLFFRPQGSPRSTFLVDPAPGQGRFLLRLTRDRLVACIMWQGEPRKPHVRSCGFPLPFVGWGLSLTRALTDIAQPYPENRGQLADVLHN